MGRITLRAAVVVALAALFTGSAASVGFAATPPPDAPPTPIDSPTGAYIVLLDEDPIATYDGGVPGLVATKPAAGQKLDRRTAAVKKYRAFLEKRQDAVASAADVDPAATYQTTLNGFSATLSPEEAAKLSVTEGVQGVYPDEILHPTGVPSTDFLGLSGPGGVWDAVGGTDEAGKGIVVGVVDTGIAPENPSFAGDPLGTTPGAQPYLDGNTVVFDKSDGTQFRSERVTGQDWTDAAYSTKLIGGQYFSSGAAAAGFNFQYDYLSPRDKEGHGSHTSSTAAGDNGVEATVRGVDLGPISGVAPAAKLAMYKACYDGPDGTTQSDDICASSDLLAAIDTAVADGVDVINFSIGGAAATSVLKPIDRSFFNAAVAGVFVSAAAGNSGPGASTADHASPWYTTVAASTIPPSEGTVVLPNGVKLPGATLTVPPDAPVTAPVVYAGDVPSVSAGSAAVCLPGSLDPAKVSGRIVVCDRGINALLDKSATVAAAGGVGMVLANTTPNATNASFHAVPTIHIDAQYRAPLLDYVHSTPTPTVTLVGSNVSGIVTPTPQIGDFSSRGPMLADGSDVIKPDIAAPGVSILAAVANAAGAAPNFGLFTGTSMAAPHIAGLAALYLGVHPNASPSEIKSALMTTAYNAVDANGAPVTDPFAQGAGQVDPRRYLDPGLLYLNGPVDWAGYLAGAGVGDFGAPPIDPSDLNLASIGIGSLSTPQTVTRTVTATKPGTYTATASIPGVNVTVSPSTMTFGAAGEAQSFTIAFANASAAVEHWATGFLTWTGADGTVVRSPLAVQPVTAAAPALVSGQGITASTSVTIASGMSGDLPLSVSGLAPVQLLADPSHPVPGHSGDQDSGGPDRYVDWILQIQPGTTLAQFTLDTSDDAGSDLDLFVYRIVSPTDTRYYQAWSSATDSADEQVTLDRPTQGYYRIRAHLYKTSGPMTWDQTSALVGPGSEGSLTATPNPPPATMGATATYALSWSGLRPATKYLGLVRYGDSDVRTLVSVDAGAAAPVATVAPKVTGTPEVGRTLRATAGTWEPKKVATAIQWLRDGAPIPGATKATYTVRKSDVGVTISVQVTATVAGSVNAGTAVSNGVFVKFSSRTKATVNHYLGTKSQSYSVTVTVTPSGGAAATGVVTVRVDSKKYTGTLANGSVTFNLPKQSKGIHVVTATYAGSTTIEGSIGLSGFIVLK